MGKEIIYKKSFDGNLVLELCGNHNIGSISAVADLSVEIKYAQNSVTDTPIVLGSFSPDESGKVQIDLEQPITASHFFSIQI